MEPYGYIYLIRNAVNGKVYVGQTTTTASARWITHQWHSREKGRKNYPLYNAIRRHGKDAFSLTLLTTASDRTTLDLKERILIRAYRSMRSSHGYNCRAGGYSGGRLTEETKAKISAGNTGKIRTPEMRERTGAAQRGRKQPAEVIAKRFANAKGRKMPPRSAEHAEKIAKAVRGRKQSEEEKERRAAKLRGRKNTPETIEKMRQSALNRSTAEYREKCSQAATLRATPEYREKCRQGAMRRIARNAARADMLKPGPGPNPKQRQANLFGD